jgi:hypothetical protein
MYTIVLFYVIRVFRLGFQSHKISQSRPFSRVQFLELLAKITPIICVSVSDSRSYIMHWNVGCFILYVVSLIS